MKFPVFITWFPLHLVSWIAAVSIQYFYISVLMTFNIPAVYRMKYIPSSNVELLVCKTALPDDGAVRPKTGRSFLNQTLRCVHFVGLIYNSHGYYNTRLLQYMAVTIHGYYNTPSLESFNI
jgi:hypothetical protein